MREPRGGPPSPSAPPRPIDARAVLQLAWRVILNFANDRVTFLAGGAVFFILLGAFPALSAFLALYGLWGDPNQAPRLLNWLKGAAPPEVLAYLAPQMARLARSGGASLTAQFAASMLFWIWAADAAVKALIYGLNLAQHEVDRRSYVSFTWLTLRLTLAGLVFLLLVSALMAVSPRIEADLGLHLNLTLWRWPLLFFAYMAMLWTLYRWGPCRKRGNVRRIWPGAWLATVLSLGLSALFSRYLDYVARLSATYGPLGATVGFMLWAWLTVIAVLAGGELNGELERCTRGEA
jgi:membrane protein